MAKSRPLPRSSGSSLARPWDPGTLGPSDFGATNVDVPSRFSGELAFKGSFQDVFFFVEEHVEIFGVKLVSRCFQ